MPRSKANGPTNKERVFVDRYLIHFNAAKAAREAGYAESSAAESGNQVLKRPHIQAMIKERLAEVHLSSDEALKILADIARGDIADVLNDDLDQVDAKKAKKNQKTNLIKSITTTVNNRGKKHRVEMYSRLEAVDKVLRVHGLYKDLPNAGSSIIVGESFSIPADKIAPAFTSVYRDIVQRQHTEYVLRGGRGSAKSSFVAEAMIYLLLNDSQSHGLALRQVADTLRDSVYARLQWAIGLLGLSDRFKSTLSPMEIEYLPTGQKIYFRGADDPGKIKSITPTFGYIKSVWFEELDQFRGLNSIRTVEQSIRGGDDIYYFKSFNPPPTKSNWANKYLTIPKANQYKHFSNYLGLPEEYLLNEELRKAIPIETMANAYAHLAIPHDWLGKTWLEDAEHLKSVNPLAYEHEYLGIPVNDGGLVFPNVRLRAITDNEIAQFDRVHRGLDWGYAINPASMGVMHFDATRRKLFIFDEAQHLRLSNERLFKALVKKGLIPEVKTWDNEQNKELISYPDLIIGDSAEPKSIGDFKSYGANIRGAEKGPESVRYSIKWLQGLTEIVIDPVRAPKHAQEFSNYEYERTKDNEIIDEYPDKNNDTIDDTRYATNLIWRRRGE